jgi:hypothetical protein
VLASLLPFLQNAYEELFMNKNFLILLLLATSTTSCTDLQKKEPADATEVTSKEPTKLLHNVGHHYIDYLIQFSSQTIIYEQNMHSLFAPNCKKIMNGAIVANNSHELYMQLEETKKQFHSWHIQAYRDNIFSNQQNNTWVVQYDITTAQLGTMIVMAYLKLDPNGLICEINEVYNKKD